MKKLIAIAALLLTLGAPLAQAAAGTESEGGQGTTTAPAGEILD